MTGGLWAAAAAAATAVAAAAAAAAVAEAAAVVAAAGAAAASFCLGFCIASVLFPCIGGPWLIKSCAPWRPHRSDHLPNGWLPAVASAARSWPPATA